MKLLVGFWTLALALSWQADSVALADSKPRDLNSCVIAWTAILQQTNVNAGVSALLGGSCNMPQQGYVVPNNVTPPGLNCALQACPLQGLPPGSTQYVTVPPPFTSAILTPWGQLPPKAPDADWVILTNGMEHSGVPVLQQYAQFLRFWVYGDGCRLASRQLYPADNPAYHCSSLGDY